MSSTDVMPEKRSKPSAWAPLAHPAFLILWLATILSNVGTWMHDVGAGWLMTELAPSPVMVAAVQAATTLPVFLFALVAGAVADIVDRRRLLLVVNMFMGLVAACLALVVWLNAMTPALLLLFTFLLGAGAAFMAPAWQAIVPSLIPKPELQAAIALNSMGINVSRAIGPALAGFLIVAVGLWSPFALNALSFVGIIAALIWWRPPETHASKLPPEHVGSAVAVGLRHAANSGALRATLIRAAAFFTFASALWAMLPLIARDVLQGGPTLYGLILAAIGAGAVGGAILLPKIKDALGPDRLVAAGTIGTGAVLTMFALVPISGVAIVAGLLAGASWIAVLSSLHVSAQTALPEWVRARGLSIFLTVFFGAMSLGSLAWGSVAASFGVPTALLIAAAGAALMIPLTWRSKLNQGAGLDHAPSLHWPAPPVVESADDHHPVRIEIDYIVSLENRQAFLDAVTALGAARRRGGGYGWTVMEDADQPGRFVESWSEVSWTQHLRHHERVSGEDRKRQDALRELLVDGEIPRVRHLLTPSR
ncbi:MAG: MFS transporter [Pseudomonadota bacterium]